MFLTFLHVRWLCGAAGEGGRAWSSGGEEGRMGESKGGGHAPNLPHLCYLPVPQKCSSFLPARGVLEQGEKKREREREKEKERERERERVREREREKKKKERENRGRGC